MSRKSSLSSTDQPSVKKTQPPAYEESKDANENPLAFKSDVEQPSKDVKLKYPRSVFFIVTNEFCERFCYYGMRTVLTLYMRNILGFSESTSVVLYHTFIMLCYFTPVLGAIIADSWLGKFKTILILSIFYACGSIILSVAAIPNTLPQVEFSMVGLFIIAFGTGGIKPCVSAFGGDQFVLPQQERHLEAFFSVFYFAINAGSLISTFVTPILREDVHCFGQDSCYSAAFGLPALLMLVAVGIFVAGYPLYTIKKPTGNIFGDFCMCIGRAIRRKFSRKTSKDEKHNHWLEFASDKYDKQLIEDIKRVLAIGFIYLPLPVFWALYDQQGSRWTFQATRMNGDLGGWVLKPDQMQIVNPLLILIMVPIFESLIYPAFKKCGLLTPLQRITCGLILCGVSFVISGFVEIGLEPTYEKIPEVDKMQLNFINTLDCDVNLSYYVRGDINGTAQFNQTYPTFATDFLPAFKEVDIEATLANPGSCLELGPDPSGSTVSAQIGFPNGTEGYSVLITIRQGKLAVTRLVKPEQLKKSVTGQPLLGFIVNLNEQPFLSPSTGLIYIKRGDYRKDFTYNSTSETMPLFNINNIVQVGHEDVELGSFDLYFQPNVNVSEATVIGNVTNLIQGGVYTVLIQLPFSISNGKGIKVQQIEVTTPNSVSILWLLPQYFVVTVAEVMFSVTGLTFSFTQAPVSMKSILQAMWQLIVAFGNLIVIIVEEANGLKSRSAEFFLFAGIMGIAAVIFTILAIPYKYVETEEEKKKKLEDAEEEKRRLSIRTESSNSSSSSDNENTETKKGEEEIANLKPKTELF